jgi:ATP-dependent RNA helicase HelY
VVAVARNSRPGDDTELSPAERYAAAKKRAQAERSELAQFRKLMDFPLDDFQVEACEAVEQGSGVLVAAPTGAGKTVVGEFAVHLALATGRKAFYTTPIKALSNQKYTDLVRRYGAGQVGLLTGDTTQNGEAPVVVMTTEVLRNMLYAGSTTLDGLGYVVMDEVHYLADRFRGPVWEEVIIHLPDDVQLVSLSATVSNAEEFGDWLRTVRGDTAVVVSEHRPVPLGQHVLVRDDLLDLYAGHVDPTAPGRNPPINPELAHLLRRADRSGDGPHRGRGRAGDRGFRGPGGRRRDGGGGSGGPGGGGPGGGPRPVPRPVMVDVLDEAGLLPAIVFIFSRAACDAAVSQCLAGGLRLTTPAEQAEIRHIAETRCASIPQEDLDVVGYWGFVEALVRGVAAHHAGMLPAFKETVEEAFARGLVKVVFATETLALGINMPARSVVLEKLVKWDGSHHVDMTPGEYTQLTGRAGRRGIDTEGHAVVVGRGDLDPMALAGLASKRLYPLRSAFRPTYNMAVNLTAQVGRVRAREVLETSFAQFQADRGVVGLARQAQGHAEALEGYAEAMTCHLGDFREYWSLRKELSDRERGVHRASTAARREAAALSLQGLQVGDVVAVPSGRRATHAVVVDAGTAGGFEGARPLVLTTEREVRRLSVQEVGDGVKTLGHLRVPKEFSARAASSRRDLAAALRTEISSGRIDGAAPPGRRGRAVVAADEDEAIARLRRELRAHPCHQCPDREEHARWAERWQRLEGEHRSLVRRIEGRTGSIAVVFDRICDVLARLGYLAADDDGVTQVTDDGRWLRRIYAENDLLLAECLRRGAWDDLDVPGLAAAVSAVVYSARRDDRDRNPAVPGGPAGRLGVALEATTRIWSELDDLEVAHRLESTQPLDLGLVSPVHKWAAGRSLDAVLRDADIAAGDFVRWCKQVVDVLDQVAKAAPDAKVRETARKAVGAVRRGVVAYAGT